MAWAGNRIAHLSLQHRLGVISNASGICNDWSCGSLMQWEGLLPSLPVAAAINLDQRTGGGTLAAPNACRKPHVPATAGEPRAAGHRILAA